MFFVKEEKEYFLSPFYKVFAGQRGAFFKKLPLVVIYLIILMQLFFIEKLDACVGEDLVGCGGVVGT